MLRSETVEKLVKLTGYEEEVIENVFSSLIDVIKDSVHVKGESIMMRNLGTFKAKKSSALTVDEDGNTFAGDELKSVIFVSLIDE